MAHVSLDGLASSTAPIQRSTRATSFGGRVVPNSLFSIASMGLAPQIPVAEMGHKSGGSCHRHRLDKRGTRCFCGGKMVESFGVKGKPPQPIS